MIELRQSTANQEVPLGYFLDSSDGDTEETALTISNTDIKIWKWGATSLVSKNSGGATHMSNGIYYVVLDATDTDTVGPGVIFVHVSGALAVRLEFTVLPANVWDSKYGSDKLEVDVVQIGGVTQSATDLKDFADTGYDPSTHKVQGVVLADTANALGTQAKLDVNAEVDTALSDIGLDHLISASVAGTDITDNSIIAKLVSKSATADWDDFDNTTDSLEAIRDALVDASPLGHSATSNSEEGNTVLVDGDYTDTFTPDGTNYYETSPGAAVGGYGLDCNLTFNIGTGRTPSVVVIRGHFDAGAQRTVQVWAYNYNTSSYDQISNSTNDFGNSGTDATQEYALGIDNVRITDGEVKIRFTSTSETGTDVWYCDYVNVASVALEAAGLTADTIQKAVWARSSVNGSHDDGTLGYNLSRMFLVQGDVASATDATKFVIDSGSSVNDAYNGMIITIEDKTDGHYETRRIIDYVGSSKEITVDRAFGFTPAAGDEFYILNAYADVNVTHISGTAQTANDNGADINAILADTNELQINQGNWVTATGFATSAELSTHDSKLDTVDTVVDAIKAKTDNLPASPAAVGSEMNLADDAITAAKFDETTAFPIKSADSGSTQIARTGADGDTLETLSDQLDGTSTHSAADVWSVATRALTDKSDFNLAADQSDVTIGTVNALGTQAKADVNAEVDNALDTAIPGSPTADSINDYIERIKKVTVNKMTIDESNGNTVIYDDNDTTEFVNVAGAFTSSGGVTTRKRLE